MMNKKKLALFLLFSLVVSIGYAYIYTPRQKHLPCSTEDVRQAKESAKNESVPLDTPSLSIRGEAPRYPGYHADLFRSLFDSAPPPKPKSKNPAPSLKAPSRPLLPPSPLPLEALDSPELPVARELARFIYLGQVREAGKRAIFLKRKDRIFVVRMGDVFGEKKEFRLAQVTEKEIRIVMGEGGELICIPLEKEKALTARSVRNGTSSSPPHLPEGATL